MPDTVLPAAPAPTVLLVDDDSTSLYVMEALLRPHYQIMTAQGPREALAVLAALPAMARPDCVISDQRMPHMSGIDLLAHLRAGLPGAARVLVSGNVDLDSCAAAVNRAQIHALLLKPFVAEVFLAIVGRAVRRAREQASHAERYAHVVAGLQRQLDLLDDCRGRLAQTGQRLADVRGALAAAGLHCG